MGETLHGGASRGRLLGHQGPVLAVRFTATGEYCLTAGKDRTVRLWNPATCLCIKAYEGHGNEVREAQASPDNSRICSAGGDRQVFLWDVARARTVRRFRGHDAAVNAVCFGAGGAVVVSGGYDQAVKAWDCRSQSIDAIQSVTCCRDSVTSVAVEGAAIYAASVDGTVVTLDVRMGRSVVDTLGPPVVCLRPSHDGKSLLAACLGGSLRLLDRGSGAALARYAGHINDAVKLDCDFTSTDAYVVAGSEDGCIYYWDLVSANIVKSWKAHGSTVCSLACHPRGEMLLSAAVDGVCEVWQG